MTTGNSKNGALGTATYDFFGIRIAHVTIFS